MTTDSDVLSEERVSQALRGAALWLTPKVVEDYAAEDFGEWPPDLRARLDAAVSAFRMAAGAVPANAPPTKEQFTTGLIAFRELVAAVREVILLEWTNAVGRMICDVERWVAESGWRSRRVDRPMAETLLGRYTLPQLQVFGEADLYVFDPVARFVPAALGSYDVSIQPSYHTTSLYRDADGSWQVRFDAVPGAGGRREPWCRESLLATFTELRALVLGEEVGPLA